MHNRYDLVLKFWDKSKKLAINYPEYRKFVKSMYSLLQAQDIKSGDLTTNSVILKKSDVIAKIIAKEEGILAGVEEFNFLNKDLRIKNFKNDGDKIKKGDVLLAIKGSCKKILQRERCSLNLLQRMSGIAALTHNLSKKTGDNVKIACTRKTLWGYLDKKAVSVGGGLTHRLNLHDGVIIKDNHLKILNGDIEKSIKNAKNKSNFIEIEVEDKNQALKAAKAIEKIRNEGENYSKNKLFAIMFDKISPNGIKSIIKELKKQNLYKNILFEASGNINENNFNLYLGIGVDVISMGFITNSAKALDMTLRIK